MAAAAELADEMLSQSDGGGANGGGRKRSADEALGTPTLDRIESRLMNLEQVDADDLDTAGNELCNKWLCAFSDDEDPVDTAYALLGLHRRGEGNTQALAKVFDREFQRIVLLYKAYQVTGFIQKDGECMVGQRYVRMMQVLKSARHIVHGVENARMASNMDRAAADAVMNKFASHLVEESAESPLSPWQKLLLYLLDKAQFAGYRKRDGKVYRQIITRDGYPSRAWEEVLVNKEPMTVEKFVYDSVPKEEDFEAWRNMTSGQANIGRAAEYLSNSNRDLEFIFLNVDRHLFSCRTGVFDTSTLRWYPHVAEAEAEALEPSRVAVNYFDLYFDYDDLVGNCDGDWRNIPTPYLHSILTYQQLPAEAIDWMYIMIGRMLFEAGTRDGWQVVPFIKGRAQTGKSTILKVVDHIFGRYTGILANNMEGKFGLYPVMYKFALLCLEVKEDFGMDQGDFQSIASNENISVPVKHKAAVDNYKMPGPLMLAGNVVPAWGDNSEALKRRFFFIEFARKVNDVSTRLFDNLKLEVMNIIVKSAMAYTEASVEYKDPEIWKVVPKYFLDCRRKMFANNSPLAAFLNDSGLLQFDTELFMPLKTFKNLHNQFIQTNKYPSRTWNEDYYKTTFEDYRLMIEPRSRRTYHGAEINDQWVSGADVAEEDNGGGAAAGGAAAGMLDMAPLPALDVEEATRRAVHVRALVITGSDDDYVQEKEFLAAVKRAVAPRVLNSSTVVDPPADNTRLDYSVRDGVKANWVIGVRLSHS